MHSGQDTWSYTGNRERERQEHAEFLALGNRENETGERGISCILVSGQDTWSCTGNIERGTGARGISRTLDRSFVKHLSTVCFHHNGNITRFSHEVPVRKVPTTRLLVVIRNA